MGQPGISQAVPFPLSAAPNLAGSCNQGYPKQFPYPFQQHPTLLAAALHVAHTAMSAEHAGARVEQASQSWQCIPSPARHCVPGIASQAFHIPGMVSLDTPAIAPQALHVGRHVTGITCQASHARYHVPGIKC
mmetsp:Transcript_25683/g.66133  ORF Transcript_25683/g.66133 Transcript_25683/m.66133 type:complete len:133 (-) Transcript_25683:48-446(-)